MTVAITLAERRWLPDAVIRFGIRRQLRSRLHQERRRSRSLEAWASELAQAPIAVEQDAANQQHYEVPAAFFQAVLGPHLKYSCCFWEDGDDLAAAEARMLATTCERAALTDGQEVLEIGCGWGSLSLFMAQRYPHSRITAISNSASQRAFISARAAAAGLDNLHVLTADIADYQHPGPVDRIVSVECFEHLRNYHELFARLRRWLHPQGLVFVHVFCHRELAYPFAIEQRDDWMSKHFFTGGQMPAFGLFDRVDRDLRISQRWQVDGTHYARTAAAWLRRLDAAGDEADLFPDITDPSHRKLLRQRWRMFFMACEELFAADSGQEWFVGHYCLRPVSAA